MNNILNKIAQMERNAEEIQLASHKVELGLQDDLKAQFNKYFSVDNIDVLELGIIDSVKKLNRNYVATVKEFEAFVKIYQNFQKKAIELGVEIPKDIQGYKTEVFRFMKDATDTHKKYLSIKV